MVSTARMAVSMLEASKVLGVERLTVDGGVQNGAYVILFGNCGAGYATWHSCPLRVPTPTMIRRSPTLIAMSDADVQDVRNMLAKKQAESVKSPISNANVKGRQGPPPQPPPAAVHVTDEAKRRREAREERLGMTH